MPGSTNIVLNAKEIWNALTGDFPMITELWIFGSRRYETLSTRSDIDILVCIEGTHVRAADLRNFVFDRFPALDLFLVDGGKAVSCVNGSFVKAPSFQELVMQLDAVLVWSRAERVSDARTFEVSPQAFFAQTELDGGPPRLGWGRGVRDFLASVASEGLPTRPFIASDFSGLATFLTDVLSAALRTALELRNTKTRSTWKTAATSEYDVQELFRLVVKPWLPDLDRERTVANFDGQDKNVDFSLGGNKLLIELKFVDDTVSKAAVAKTLEGLKDFYRRNANVRALLFLVVVDDSKVVVDAGSWATTFSAEHEHVPVFVRVLILPK